MGTLEGIGTGMSEAPILFPILLYAAVGGALPSSFFRQGNWGQTWEVWQGSDPAACNLI
jgi:hypothetical protein